MRQLDAVAARVLSGLAETTPVLTAIDDLVFVDVDDTIIGVHGHSKQGSGYGYSGVRGLNALLATVTTASAAPVIVAQRAWLPVRGGVDFDSRPPDWDALDADERMW